MYQLFVFIWSVGRLLGGKVIFIKALFYLYLRAKGYNRETAGIIISQAIFETNDFSSSLYRDTYNAFGMYEPKSRASNYAYLTGRSEVGHTGNFVGYNNPIQSLDDRILRDEDFTSYNTKNSDLIGYVTYLVATGYFKGSVNDYKAGLLAKIGTLEKELQEYMPKLVLIVLLGLSAVGIFIYKYSK